MNTLPGMIGLLGVAFACCCAAAEPGADDLRSPLPAVRAQAARDLGRAPQRSAVPALTAVLRDADANVRRSAAFALGAIPDGRAVEPLAAALGDADENVRASAAYALGEIKDPRSTAALLHALRDGQWSVRDQAAWALREIGDRRTIEPLCQALAEPAADAPHLLWLLRHLAGAEAVPRLAALLKAPELETRRRAVCGLIELGDPAALSAALGDSDEGIRRAALEGLLALGGERVEAALDELLKREKSPALRVLAEQGLARISKLGALAAHWSFDDRSTKLARDVSGHGNDGEIRGCVTVDGRGGAALQFGKGKFVELDRPGGLPLTSQPFTIAAWIKTDAPNGVVVARGGAFGGYSLYLKDGRPKFGVRTQRDRDPFVAAGKEPVLGAWTHVAGVVCNDRVELYVNGRLAASVKSNGYFPGNCGQGMEIGFDAGNSAVEITDAFEGLIDEVKVFHAELTAKELARECR